MKTYFRVLLILVGLVGGLSACNTPSTDDVVNTAVAGTQLAQATVNASVLTAMPAIPTPGPTVEYFTMTEEELATLIEQAVAEAVMATEQTTLEITTITSDDTVTLEEVVYVYGYYYYADYYVQHSEQLLNEYYALYADLAEEMITKLNSIEAELAQMNTTLSSIDSSLQQINSSLEQGLAVAQETINQFETAAKTAQTNAQELKAQAEDMMSRLQLDQEGRLMNISQIQPNSTPTDRISSLQMAFQFFDAAHLAMGDDKLSRDELTTLAQLGVNAQAGFQAFGGNAGSMGGPDLSQFDGKFSEITNQLARGQLPQARGNLDLFEHSLGDRPRPGG